MQKVKKMRDKFSPLTVIMLILLSIYCLALIYMLIWALLQTIKLPEEFAYDKVNPPKLKELSLVNFKAVFYYTEKNWTGRASGSPGIPELLLNTGLYSIGGAFLNVAITCLMAYLTAKYNYFYSKIIYGIVIVVMATPIVGAQASELEILRFFNLYDTRYTFIVLKASFVGMYFLVFYEAFKGIPMTYTEAAMLDGAGDWYIMTKIYMPLIRNVFATVMLIIFIQYWNDYQLAMLYMPSYPTLSYFIFTFQQAGTGNVKIPGYGTLDPRYTTVQLAATFVLIIPILAIFIALHEKLMGNLTIGGIKG